MVTLRDDFSPGMANNEILQAVDRLNHARYKEMVSQAQADIREARESGDTELLRDSIAKMSELASDKSKFAPKVSPYFHDLRSTAS